MQKTTAYLLSVGAVCLTLFLCVVCYLALQANKVDGQRMEACVSNGGEWIRDHGSYYECRR